MNEKYDGLNLPQLLELLHDIVMPESVSWLPQTVGWWIALAWIIVVSTLIVVKLVARRRRNRYRHEALARLAEIDTDAPPAGGRIAALIKRTALVAYPRDRVASLYGATWAAFLVETADDDPEVEQGARRIAEAAYRPDVDAASLVAPARRWIRVHRA